MKCCLGCSFSGIFEVQTFDYFPFGAKVLSHSLVRHDFYLHFERDFFIFDQKRLLENEMLLSLLIFGHF